MAGLAQSTVRISGFEYECTLLQVAVGHPLRWELIKLLGDSLVHAIGGFLDGGLAEVKVEALLPGLAQLFRRLEPAFVMRAQLEFVKQTRCRELGATQWVGLSDVWEVHFAGRYDALDQLTWHHLRQNYLSFLADSAGWSALISAGEKVLSGSRSPKASQPTTTSGASSAASDSA